MGQGKSRPRLAALAHVVENLCCSTWLTDFKSVSTAAARYQNLAINQAKLSGQCGRLKCCLNYELSNYLEVLKEFPKNVDKIKTKKGIAFLLKTDIFKRQLFYAYRNDFGISEVQVLSIPQVNELKRLNDSGVEPETLTDIKIKNDFDKDKEAEIEFVDNIDGVLHLKPFEKNKNEKVEVEEIIANHQIIRRGSSEGSNKKGSNIKRGIKPKNAPNKGQKKISQRQSQTKGGDKQRKSKRNKRIEDKDEEINQENRIIIRSNDTPPKKD